jgi:hypothetical protein
MFDNGNGNWHKLHKNKLLKLMQQKLMFGSNIIYTGEKKFFNFVRKKTDPTYQGINLPLNLWPRWLCKEDQFILH